MDKYYGNVCELDIIFNFQKAYFILDELLLAGEMQESSKKNVLRCISQQDSLEDMEVRVIAFASLGRSGAVSFFHHTEDSCLPTSPIHMSVTDIALLSIRSRMMALPKSCDGWTIGCLCV